VEGAEVGEEMSGLQQARLLWEHTADHRRQVLLYVVTHAGGELLVPAAQCGRAVGELALEWGEKLVLVLRSIKQGGTRLGPCVLVRGNLVPVAWSEVILVPRHIGPKSFWSRTLTNLT